MENNKEERAPFQIISRHRNVAKNNKVTEPLLLQKDLLDLPVEIINHVLTYIRIKNLSLTISMTCTKIFDISQHIPQIFTLGDASFEGDDVTIGLDSSLFDSDVEDT